jgi:hypothetical protein
VQYAGFNVFNTILGGEAMFYWTYRGSAIGGAWMGRGREGARPS